MTQGHGFCGLQDLPYTIFQPLYIYGPYTGKDYMRFFLDRLLRNRPVLIPSPGIQLTSLSHVEDVASLLAKVCVCAELHTTCLLFDAALL